MSSPPDPQDLASPLIQPRVERETRQSPFDDLHKTGADYGFSRSLSLIWKSRPRTGISHRDKVLIKHFSRRRVLQGPQALRSSSIHAKFHGNEKIQLQFSSRARDNSRCHRQFKPGAARSQIFAFLSIRHPSGVSKTPAGGTNAALSM